MENTFKTQSGHTFKSAFKIESGDYVLLNTVNGDSILDRVLPADYVEQWPGSASTLEVGDFHIEVVA